MEIIVLPIKEGMHLVILFKDILTPRQLLSGCYHAGVFADETNLAAHQFLSRTIQVKAKTEHAEATLSLTSVASIAAV